MQKVKMVDYAGTDPCSFKNALLRHGAGDVVDEGGEANEPKPSARAQNPRDVLGRKVTAENADFAKRVATNALVICVVTSLYSLGHLCGLV
jgi:hypothetical protein